MSKNNTKKNLIEAHSWLGIVMSLLLFLVFWAGAISLFMAEIQQWAELPHYPINQSAENKPLLDIIEDTLVQYPLNTEEHLSIVVPSEHNPYYLMKIDLLPKENKPKEEKEHAHTEEEVLRIKIHPKTGETIGEADQFPLANFFYSLHYNLNYPSFGGYLIGIVTLFFLFAIFSGIYIHAPKLIRQFFSYRIKKERTLLLDLHNVVGVMSLPFTLMYAVTGLVFNLAIIFQIALVIFVYQGNQNTLFKDAGYAEPVIEQQAEVKQDMAAILPLIEQTKISHGPIIGLTFHHYGDENAVLKITGHESGHFSQYYEIFYKVKDGTIIQQSDYAHLNAFRKGREVMLSLHFGSFAGVDLRILYFLLAIAVAVMILAGNLLWINKRKGQPNVSQRATQFFARLTAGTCCGFVLTAAVGFLIERTLPTSLMHRADILITTLISTFAIVSFAAYFFNNQKAFISKALYATTAILLITVAADWLMFSKPLIMLWQSGFTAVFGVQIGLLLFGVVTFYSAKRLGK